MGDVTRSETWFVATFIVFADQDESEWMDVTDR